MSLNTSSAPSESANNWQSSRIVDVHALLRDSLAAIMYRDDQGTIDLKAFHAFRDKPQDLLRHVQVKMHALVATKKDYYRVSAGDIAQITTSLVMPAFLSMTAELSQARQDAQHTIESRIRPNYFDTTAAGKKRKQDLISRLDGYSIEKLHSIAQWGDALTKVLKKDLKVPDNQLIHIDTFFADLGITSAQLGSSENQQKMRSIVEKYLSNKSLPSWLANDILPVIRGIWDDNARFAIAQYFLPTLSVAQLREAGIVDSRQSTDIVKKALLRRMAEISGAPDTYLTSFESDSDLAEALPFVLRELETLKIPLSELVSDGVFSQEVFLQKLTEQVEDTTRAPNPDGTYGKNDSDLGEALKSALKTKDSTQKQETWVLSLVPDASGNYHESFLKSAWFLIHKDGSPVFKNQISREHVKNLTVGNWLVGTFSSAINAPREYWHIVQIDVKAPGRTSLDTGHSDGFDRGVMIENYSTGTHQKRSSPSSHQFVSYADLAGFMTNEFYKTDILSDAEISERLSPKHSEPILEAVPVAGEITSLDGLIAYLDTTDANGREHGLSEGLSFEVKATLSKWFGEHEIYRIKKITSTGLEIEWAKDGSTDSMTFAQFAAANDSQPIERLWKLKTFDDFKKRAASVLGSDWGHIDIDHGHLVIKQSDGKSYAVTEIAGRDIFEISHLDDHHLTLDHIKSHGEKGNKDKPKKITRYEHIDYDVLLSNLRWSGAKELKRADHEFDHNDPHPHEHADHEHAPHLHGGFFPWFLSGLSVGDLLEAPKSLAHGIKHHFEAKNKRQALRAKRRLQWLLGHKIGQYMEHEIASESASAIKAEVEHLKGNSPLLMREHIAHILEGKYSDFEQIHAALIVALEKGGGQLYFEKELSRFQWQWLFFRRLCEVYNVDYETMKAKCRKRAADQGDFTEELAIDSLFKTIQGKYGSGDEGFKHSLNIPTGMIGMYGGALGERKNAIQGATEKFQAFPTADARVGEIWGKLDSREFSTVIGALPTISGKSTAWNHNGPFVGFVMMGAPDYIQGALSQEVKAKFHSTGNTFHATAFMADSKWAQLYQDTMASLVGDLIKEGKLPVAAAGALRDIAELRSSSVEDMYNKKIVAKVRAFWESYGNTLHPYLQLSNEWIRARSDHPTYGRYYNQIKGIQSDPTYSNFNETAKNTAVYGNYETKIGNPGLFANDVSIIFSQVDRISADMDGPIEESMWKNGVITRLEQIRDLPLETVPSKSPADLEKYKWELFREYYAALMYTIKGRIPKYYTLAGKVEWMKSLTRMGFNLTNNDDGRDDTADSANAHEAFRRFMIRQRGDVSSTNEKTSLIQKEVIGDVQILRSAANDPSFDSQQRA